MKKALLLVPATGTLYTNLQINFHPQDVVCLQPGPAFLKCA